MPEPRMKRPSLPYEPIEGERWLSIPGFENYLVSDHGRVWSIARPRTRGGLLRQGTTTGGYKLVVLLRNGRERSMRVHTLVATAFHGESDLLVLHWDGDPANNRAENLRWGTSADNAADLRRHRQEGVR